jgi:hypothetical protein
LFREGKANAILKHFALAAESWLEPQLRHSHHNCSV